MMAPNWFTQFQVCRPLWAGARNALFVGTNGGGHVLNFADLDCPETVARYSATPWFVGMDRKGNTAARLVPGKPDVLEIFDASLTNYSQLSAQRSGKQTSASSSCCFRPHQAATGIGISFRIRTRL